MSIECLAPVPPEAFDEIIEELRAKPLARNEYRNKSGAGRSQAFGIVNRRCLPPDMSRQCWIRPKLYGLLQSFVDRYCPFSDWTSITINQNYAAAAHYDKGNEGKSYLVAFGTYQGGELVLHEDDLSGEYDIRHKPLLFDGAKILHSVNAFQGERYSIVIYRMKGNHEDLLKLRQSYFTAEDDGGKWKLYKKDTDGGYQIAPRLAHPLLGRVKN